MKNLLTLIILISSLAFSQTKVSGIILDDAKQPVSYATVAFKNSAEGVIADENGKFYLESKKTFPTLVVSFVGYKDKEISLSGEHNYDLKIVLENANEIAEVKVYGGKTSKKNNPAIDILRKIWERKKKNGLRQFNQYEYDKYEKIEFDINSIDSTFMKNKIFKNVEFIF
uniref:carboxypeptidase-like regulatory domain-containing protein n=1 Tax=Flavobacterium sp. TaxID=239 RepID=UPI0037BF7040